MICPYLTFNGDCEQALKLYGEVLGAKVDMMMRYGEAPPEMPCAPEHKDRIMHVRFSIAGDVVMASDSPPEYYHGKPNGISVSLQIADPAEAERKFNALLEGGAITMPFGKTFWSKGFGMGVDRFGIPWMINSPADGYEA
ncbi:Glyoxalase family protein [Bradyrhizobium sp. ORS 285]|uniref:VOC family protein n=1 Tax=Bradyrhizobium sp. ORS 285 TaxID=115808 RepID=UPI00024084D6|nr:VOC family protein [Bradyrhizobium sp. ORS 285]CCD89142.1 Glyoxalase family protein [Bradyrhizobium sp. ORS 285]SMX55969.1 Glyoxalase family protein [Bradyrhizobium sp. ORS 285]